MTEATKWTAGPWIAHGEVKLVGDPNSSIGQHNHFCGSIYPADGGYVGSICDIQSADHIESGISRDHAAANARLIAASPDMAEALRLVRASTEWSCMERDVQDAVDAALAKAGVS